MLYKSGVGPERIPASPVAITHALCVNVQT